MKASLELHEILDRLMKKKLGVYLILASILFQYVALNSLSMNLFNYLSSNEALNWSFHHSSSVVEQTWSQCLYLLLLVMQKLSRGKMIIIGSIPSNLLKFFSILICHFYSGLPLYLTGYTLFTLTASETNFICHDILISLS